MEQTNLTTDPMREQLYLAALLHDIGKFYQRADTGAVHSSKYIKEETRKLEAIICPLYDGSYSHKHVLWTAQFISDYENVFNNLLQKAKLSGLNSNQKLLQLAAAHHLKPEQLSFEGRIIREADHLSSGMDRSTDIAFQDEQDESKWDSFKTKRMVSVFEGVLKPKHIHQLHLPVEPINLKKSFFPQTDFGDPDYAALWKEFNNEFKFLQQENYRDFSETFLYLLYKYTCTIPSSTINFPDVSLYDHLKTTAAIAVCLYDWEQEAEDKNSDPFLLIGADFSGIQDYIYNIISKSAAKNLKGRSFYLKLLSDSVVRLLIDRLNLFEANVIYNAGGGFYILAPNTPATKEKLEEVTHFNENQIFETHGTSLYVAIDSVSISKATLMGTDHKNTLGTRWGELFEKRDSKKKQRYQQRLVADYSSFFEPGKTGGTALRDAITGEEIPEGEEFVFLLDGSKLRKSDAGATGNEVVSELTYKQISLGRKLREADVWVISRKPLTYWSDRESINPGNLGVYYYFLTEKDIKKKAEELKASADSVKIITINGKENGEVDFLNTMIQGCNNVYGFEFFGGNDFPADGKGDPKFFDELAGEEGFRRLGVLRMDVDNLGLIFQKGIKTHQSSFSRYAALSRNLDWFFKGYLNTLWRKNFSDTTYIIYSGGDDLFIVGHWNQCIAFAEKIRQEFKAFTCMNQNLNISGGIAIITPKYPIKKAAEESAEAEKAAKNFMGDTKNAVCFLGRALGWDNEFPVVASLKESILQWLQADKLTKSFISKLNAHYAMAEAESKDKEFTLPPKLYWMMAYDFSRLTTRLQSAEARQLIEQCKTDVVSNTIHGKRFETYHALQLWHLAARWAELEYRTKNNNN